MDLTRQRAHWIDRSTLAWRFEGPVGDRRCDLVWSPDAGLEIIDGALVGPHETLPLRVRPGGLSTAQRRQWPHLADHAAFTVEADEETIKRALRSQVVVTARDDGGWLLVATGAQLPGVLDDVYADAVHADLGCRFHDDGGVTISVWAPTARSVALEWWTGENSEVVGMWRDDHTGVWRVDGDWGWTGRRYRFRVEVYHPATQRVETMSVTDPYSVSLTANSTHSVVANLLDPLLIPADWGTLRKPPAVSPARAQVHEVSVRDFSIYDRSVPAQKRGTFAAFATPNSTGMRHLRRLADAGVTHLHLLPAFDFATVPERRDEQQHPSGDLAALPADSAEQQERIDAVRAKDGYNWGYDPLHYSVPEGSYATDPDGPERITEFREMVAALNGAGLRVVMDVVYNHTVAGGVNAHAVLDRIVPGYYHRLLADGRVADSTCCANTAPEHVMMGKLVVDSVLRWAVDYKVDGFRFDLMGHHPRENILAVRTALDRLTPQRDGVDGRAVLIYGEGWDFGEVGGNQRFVQASQLQLAGTGIGTFNDRLRDAVRGGQAFETNPRAQGYGSGLFTDPNGDDVNGPPEHQRARLLFQQDLIKIGLTGNLASYRFVASSGAVVTGGEFYYNGARTGYCAAPGECVTYVDAHDNEILYDTLAFKLPADLPPADRARMQLLALSFTVLGQGMGFVAAGSERLRSKSLDRNSFDSGDWFNAIRWDPAEGNGFGLGLPPAWDNRDKWPFAAPLLADPTLVPPPDVIAWTVDRYLELLRIRRDSPLFGLSTAVEVQDRLSFPLSGTGETPGVITMRLTGVDDHVVVFNAAPATVTQKLPDLRFGSFDLHPHQRAGGDERLLQSAFDPATGIFTVPPRTVAVFTGLAPRE
ncbi:pullulanase-type alpha-1,6-glucosidase [Asanoa sp. NPDC050611]|uniref:pullulanase-type alpha-1,6-glucosidase n=1 Tax=Asanoa sp. NPDC050611 TaxID=3157098 RepID=UPI0033E318D5